ncbi:MAG: hypothetical protein ACRECD_15175 [Burkholderiaceae bacterium]
MTVVDARARRRALATLDHPQPEAHHAVSAPVAFALGGLAGGNGFGAGFLEAVRQRGLRPSAISCTSGMIVWTARFLAGDDLRQQFQQELAQTPAGQGLPNPLASAVLGLKGLPGVFRPALGEYWARWAQWPAASWAQTLVDRTWPVQTAIPTRPESFFVEVAEQLNASEVAVLFNAFCPPTGEEYLFLNPAAMCHLGRSPGERRQRQVFQPISAQAVKAALHLYAYGHEQLYLGQHLIDGAYHRQFILDELCELSGQAKPARLWTVRPQNACWIGRMPANYFEQRDMETEIGMNSNYAGQVQRIELVNRLIGGGELKSGRYRQVELRPFEFAGQRGFFDYFNENQAVFDMACDKAMAALV